MTDAPLTPQEEDDALAAEYVLGVLALPDRLAVETRIRRDSVLARRVSDWENRLAGLNEDFAPVPPPDLFDKIEARLFPAPAVFGRFSLRGWLSGAAVALTLGLVALLVIPPGPPRLHTTLAADDAAFRYEANFIDDRLIVTLVSGHMAPPGKSLELWLIPPSEKPISLGVLTEEEFSIPHAAPPPGWVLAVTLEPEGGSPSGDPTGPVLAAAPITAL